MAFNDHTASPAASTDRFSDWTDLYDKSSAALQAYFLTDEVLKAVHEKKLAINTDLDQRELSLLYRFPVHVGVNIFIERMLRVAYIRETKWSQRFPDVYYQPRYFRDLDESITTYYMDFALNYHYLHQIYKTLGGPSSGEAKQTVAQFRPQDIILRRRSRIWEKAKRVLKRSIEVYVILSKPAVVGEYSNWMRKILPLRQVLSFHYPISVYPVDLSVRKSIKDVCSTALLHRIDNILPGLNDPEKNGLAKLFAAAIDGIIPQSLVEGLTERRAYFEKLIRNWQVRQIHSFIGYYYNENFKIFAALARRKGAVLIGYSHGVSNPKDRKTDYRNLGCELAIVDYYFTWARNDCNWLKENLNLERLKIANLGSTYLYTIPKWKKRKAFRNELTILYPSGPLVDFMTDLEETATREKTLEHRLQVLTFLREMMRLHQGMKILYKPFPGTFTHDPIKEVFKEQILKGDVQLFSVKPLKLFPKVDAVLWDCVSTGFAESIQSGIPTLIFQSPHEYKEASAMGKSLYQAFMGCGMLFHDAESGLKAVCKITNHLDEFLGGTKEAVARFQEAVAYPIAKESFLKEWRAVIEEG